MGQPKNNVVPCEVYSRIVGYYRPVINWNNGKRQEFKDRVNHALKGVDKKAVKNER